MELPCLHSDLALLLSCPSSSHHPQDAQGIMVHYLYGVFNYQNMYIVKCAYIGSAGFTQETKKEFLRYSNIEELEGEI